MTVEEILTEVKTALGIAGDYQDETLKTYIVEVMEFLEDAGVKTASVGIITRGVADLWNYGAGKAEFSSYFMQRATQLAYKEKNT